MAAFLLIIQNHDFFRYLIKKNINIEPTYISGKYMEIDTYNDFKLAKRIFSIDGLEDKTPSINKSIWIKNSITNFLNKLYLLLSLERHSLSFYDFRGFNIAAGISCVNNDLGLRDNFFIIVNTMIGQNKG